MKPLVAILLLSISIQAQSLADEARKERERRAHLKSSLIITATGQAGPSAGAAVPVEEPKPPAPDPVKDWNEKADQLRTKIKGLQDQETALQLKENDLKQQVYAIVTDPTTQDQAQAQLGEVRQQLATVGTDLDTARKTLDQLQLEGPPVPPKK
jgi:chaperonin cofactor prefoldin